VADPLKITGFFGTVPKVTPELLPATGAQVANNCKLYSGDLIPYPTPVAVDSTRRGANTTKTLYAVRNPSTGALRWLSWTTDVDIVSLPDARFDDQRFYYTGDGAPKVSNYTLATTGAEPFPVGYYDLGLPLPTTKVTAVKSAYAEKTITTISRDSSNIVTVTTSANHNLRTGNIVNITGYGELTGTYSQDFAGLITISITAHGLSTGDIVDVNILSGGASSNSFYITVINANSFSVFSGDTSIEVGTCSISSVDLNATGVTITRTGNTTFTYFSTGPTVTSTAATGRATLSGSQELRTYVYTWITPWDEESIGSDPSADVYVIEGEEVAVTNIPTAKPAGTNFVRGVNLYRTIATSTGAEYFKLTTLWFPTRGVTVSRASNVSTVTTEFPHNLYVGAKFRITGSVPATAPVGTFNISTGTVTATVDDYTFSYAQAGTDYASQADSGATVFHDVSQTPGTSTPQYWGDGGYTFTDNFDYALLLTPLLTDDNDAPPAGLQGLKLFNNAILVGFVGKTLYFSQPSKPYAWPIKYSRTVEHNIIGLELLSGRMIVLTDAFPYIIDGTDPAILGINRMDVLYPCLNSRSIVNMGYGVVYSTNDGLAVFSGGGLTLASKQVHSQDTWYTAGNPATIRAVFYGDAYFASYSKSTYGFTVLTSVPITARNTSEIVARNGSTIIARNLQTNEDRGFIFQIDDKSSFLVNTNYSFTSAWYDATTGRLYYTEAVNSTIYEWDNLLQPASAMEWKSKVIKTPDYTNYGAARVIADYSNLTSVWDNTSTLWENTTQLWNNSDQITFRMWVDKSLIFTTTLNDNSIFRLPTGYRSDTFELSVAGNVRVRAIHLGPTPTSLMRV